MRTWILKVVGIKLNLYIQSHHGKSKWEAFIQNSDNYFIPTMAALGWAGVSTRRSEIKWNHAKESYYNSSKRVSRRTLWFLKIPAVALATLPRPSVQHRPERRAIVFSGPVCFFLEGITNPDYPLDWEWKPQRVCRRAQS